MQPLKKSTSNKNVYRFAVLFIAGLFAGVLVTYFILSANKTTSAGDNSTVQLLKETDSLKTEFSTLQSLNSNYSSILEKNNLDTTQLYQLDSLNIIITKKELSFLEHLDNIEITNSNIHSNSSDLLKSIIAGFRIAAKQSSALNAIRNSFNIGNTNYSFDQNMLATMQREFTKEASLVTAQTQVSVNSDTVIVNHTSTVTTDSSTNNILIALRKRNDVLTAANKKLQNDMQQLKNQPVNVNTPTQLNSNAASSQSDEYVNEQISLVQADCYLARADANQIISNSKQRTELLQSALKILNSLSQSGSSATKQQVQLKLSQLKRIAANNHD